MKMWRYDYGSVLTDNYHVDLVVDKGWSVIVACSSLPFLGNIRVSFPVMVGTIFDTEVFIPKYERLLPRPYCKETPHSFQCTTISQPSPT